jgi:SAM-dependent methyltransferase
VPAADIAGTVAELQAAWADRVRANREQVNRFREVPDGRDFYRATSTLFRDDPFRTDDPVLDALVALARPADVWLDVGAGAGRYALPLARFVREVVAIDPSAGMLDGLRDGMAESGIVNVRVIQGRWPDAAADLRGDVALIAHVGYDVEAIGPFVDALEGAAKRLCVAVLMQQAPASVAAPFWPAVHDEARVLLPALDEFVALLRARGAAPAVQVIPGQWRRWPSPDEALLFLRQQTWVEPGGEKDRRLRAQVDALPRAADGSIELHGAAREIGVVSWAPKPALFDSRTASVSSGG